jgi:hypothetical protein
MQTDKPTPEPVRFWHRRLRVCMATVCLALCFTTVAFWAQSYRYVGATAKIFFDTWLVQAGEIQGRIILRGFSPVATRLRVPRLSAMQLSAMQLSVMRYKVALSGRYMKDIDLPREFFGFGYLKQAGMETVIQMPHWSLVLLFGSLAAIFRPPPRTRFGLRELLVVVTLAAVAFGAVEAIMQAAPEYVFPDIP